MNLYNSLERQTERKRERERETVYSYGGYSELAGSPFVSVKINGLGKFLEQLSL